MQILMADLICVMIVFVWNFYEQLRTKITFEMAVWSSISAVRKVNCVEEA